MSNADEKFYAQRDANFKDRVYRILFDDPSGHSDEEVLELISKLKSGVTYYSQSANPNATNSELDAKVIIKHDTVDEEKEIEKLMEYTNDDIIVIDSNTNSPLFP